MPARREEPDVLLVCGHWSNLLGAVYDSLSPLGKLRQWCDRCGEWVEYKPLKKKAKPVRKTDKGALW